MSLFSGVTAAPPDPILGLTEAFNADTRPTKVNLGVGVYQDASGKLPLLDCVRRVEADLGANPQPRGYLPIDGLAPYKKAVAGLVLGADSQPYADGRVVMHGVEHAMHMPGMLTADQMSELDRARGTAFDRLFLTFMIQHHRGAIEMVRQLFGSYGAGQDELVFKFASDVNVDQTTEIARMESMLEQMTVAGASQ